MPLKNVWQAIRWRIWGIVGPLYHRRWDIACRLARYYRATLLRRVVFVGVTGSGGKTTTKEITAAVLASRYRGKKSLNTQNISKDVARTIFQVRPWDRFCVQELSVGPTLMEAIGMTRPSVAIVTNIGMDHISQYGTKENIAAEKGKLVAALPSDGTAILNADDEHVMSMRSRCAGRIITFGRGPEATVRAEDVSSIWPDRLSFTAHFGGQCRAVQTQLCGTHWVYSVLAAIAAGIALGLPFEAAVRAAQQTPPFRLRLSPVMHPDGITFIRDDWKAPLSSVRPALDFLRQARARRKIAVIGTLSDYRGDASGHYVKVAREGLAAADYVFFVGPWASRCLRAKRHPQDDALRAFSNVDDLSEFLHAFLEPGDLVLLKGRLKLDRLEKVIAACAGTSFAARADQAPLQSQQEIRQVGQPEESLALPVPLGVKHDMKPVEVVVGLGNAGERFRNTRHNVGQRVIELVAERVGARWYPEGDAFLARVDGESGIVYLVKASTKVNDTGHALLQLAERLGFAPRQCALVHDELDLSVGQVRSRTKGSAGGHNGIRSIIDAFQSEEFRRIKVGIGRPGQRIDIAEYVLQDFPPKELSAIESACAEAAKRVIGSIAGFDPRPQAQQSKA